MMHDDDEMLSLLRWRPPRPLCPHARFAFLALSLTAAAGLGDARIRDLNDEINKLLREKGHWERQIAELGGPVYALAGAPKVFDGGEALELPGSGGYKYFGAARSLPGVRELFEVASAKAKPRTRGAISRGITPDYFGYRDEDDGILLAVEATAEAEHRARLVAALAEGAAGEEAGAEAAASSSSSSSSSSSAAAGAGAASASAGSTLPPRLFDRYAAADAALLPGEELIFGTVAASAATGGAAGSRGGAMAADDGEEAGASTRAAGGSAAIASAAVEEALLMRKKALLLERLSAATAATPSASATLTAATAVAANSASGAGALLPRR